MARPVEIPKREAASRRPRRPEKLGPGLFLLVMLMVLSALSVVLTRLRS